MSRFGICGTNAHVVLEEAPSHDERPSEVAVEVPDLGLISAHSEAALDAQVAQLAALRGPDVCHTLALHRERFAHRAFRLGETLRRGIASERPTVVFVYPGQGSQWLGMGRELLAHAPVFRAAMEACDRAIQEEAGFSVLAELLADESTSGLARIEVVQPVLFAVAVGLTALWRSLGVEPDVVVGHSQGEIAAAHVAGALSLSDAARVVCRRSRLLTTIAGRGAMAQVELGAEALTARLPEGVSVAAINGPTTTVLSGPPEAIRALVEALGREQVFAKAINVDIASHSAQIDGLRGELLEQLAGLVPSAPSIRMVSTVTCEEVAGAELDEDYWVRNLREPVRFAPVVRALWERGPHVLMELSAHPLLTLSMTAVREAVGGHGGVVGTLRRERPERETLYAALGEAWLYGVEADWANLLPGRLVALPTYPFQRERHWREPAAAPRADLGAAGLEPVDHPLLGASVALPGGEHLFTARLSLQAHPWLADPVIHDTILFPGAGFVELAWAAGALLGVPHLVELTLSAPMALPRDRAVALQLCVQPEDAAGARRFAIHGQADAAGPWTEHAGGVLAPAQANPAKRLDAWPPQGAERISIDDLYARLGERGYHYGPSFRGLTEAWRVGDEHWARATLPDGLSEAATTYGLHPALLDAALHLQMAVSPDASPVRLPFAWSQAALWTGGSKSVYVRLQGDDPSSLEMFDEAMAPLGRVAALVTRDATAAQVRAASRAPEGDMYAVRWRVVGRVSDWLPPRSWRMLRTGPLGEALSVAALVEGEPAPDVLLIDATADGADPLENAQRALATLHLLLRDERLARSVLAWATRDAIATGPEDAVSGLAQAPIWGLLRSARAEHPDRDLRLVIRRSSRRGRSLGGPRGGRRAGAGDSGGETSSRRGWWPWSECRSRRRRAARARF